RRTDRVARLALTRAAVKRDTCSGIATRAGRKHDGADSPARSARFRMNERVAQVRGVLAERVVVSTQLDPFLSLGALAAYGGLSVRKLREYLEDAAHPLPCYRVGGKILVRRSEFDGWMVRYRQVGRVDVDKIVSDVFRSLKS